MPWPIAAERQDSHFLIYVLKLGCDLHNPGMDEGETRGPSHDHAYLAFITPSSAISAISRPGATPSRFSDHPGGTACRVGQGKRQKRLMCSPAQSKCLLSKPMSTWVITQPSDQVQIRGILPPLAPS